VDNESIRLMRKVWEHSNVEGNVWMPSIANIGQKGKERFREGPALPTAQLQLPDINDDVDWYWTPAVGTGPDRKVKRRNGSKTVQQYPAQRALWVDCDESYNMELLVALKPTFMWETSPGHMQAVWLMREKISPREYHRDGLMGMLTQALGADPSGVDISQLLRVQAQALPLQDRAEHYFRVHPRPGALSCGQGAGLPPGPGV
jgi:hypothetical protein